MNTRLIVLVPVLLVVVGTTTPSASEPSSGDEFMRASLILDALSKRDHFIYKCDFACTFSNQHMLYEHATGEMKAGDSGPHGCTSTHECFDEHGCTVFGRDHEDDVDLMSLQSLLRQVSGQDLSSLANAHENLTINRLRGAAQVVGCDGHITLSVNRS